MRRLGAGRSQRPWGWVLLAAVVVVGAVEAGLLEWSRGYFTSGFNGVYIRTPLEIGAFVLGGALLDATLVLATWTVCLPLLRAIRLSGLQTLTAGALLAVAVPLGVDAVRWQVLRVLGDVLSWEALWQLAGRSVRGTLAEATSQAPTAVAVLLLAALAAVAIVGAVGRLERGATGPGPRAPAVRWLGSRLLVAGVAGGALLVVSSASWYEVYFGLRSKVSAIALSWVVASVSDVDRDGFGWLSRPRDPDPFDAAIQPFALDLPGNGVDENGLAGDLPPGTEPVLPIPLGPFVGEARPDVLLVFLETFRGDLVGMRYRGRPVTPFLERLGSTEGASSRHAFVHSPLTFPSREQLLTGQLEAAPGATTLIDDFHEQGYRVGYFSGQDEVHGGGAKKLGLDRADVFYDARQDLERRTSRSTAAVSLQVSWKVLVERVSEFLAVQPPEVPLFLYVNIVDAHHPYDHDQMDRILAVDPVDRSEIRPGNAERVRATYLNAAANVDRAVRVLCERFAARRGADFVLVVTGDHGQAFYERGFLGHGQGLDASQSKVPLVLRGIGGEWPEPIGLADLRGLLRRHAFAERGDTPPRPRFVPQEGRRIFQYLGFLDRPRLLGLRGLDRAWIYDVRGDRTRVLSGPDDEPTDASDEELQRVETEVVRAWEAIRLDRARRPDGRESS